MKTFFEELTEHVADRAEQILGKTLNDDLANELAWKIADTIPKEFLRGMEIGYLLIDAETGRPESRFFKQHQEAFEEYKARGLQYCWIAAVILEP